MDAESTELDFTSLESALATLQVGIAAHKDAPEDLFIRDACIQRFEYTFELSWTTCVINSVIFTTCSDVFKTFAISSSHLFPYLSL